MLKEQRVFEEMEKARESFEECKREARNSFIEKRMEEMDIKDVIEKAKKEENYAYKSLCELLGTPPDFQ